ncbi:alcohol dehydrogenase catalytic domain-containing protein [Rhizobium acaciae]|uniref:alcohol dehydrogenase catalytic domain-containing protein n=1 Tax=Rhizobium acaciae TaxID=2989736 RepID=UPI003F97AAFA
MRAVERLPQLGDYSCRTANLLQPAARRTGSKSRSRSFRRRRNVIVKITKTTICGSDLHILKGDVPSVTEGRALDHEGVGVVEDVGNVVRSFRINRLSF